MNDEDIFEAIKQRISTGVPQYPLVLPNEDSEPAKPYLVMDLNITSRTNRSLSGGIEVAMGFCQLSLVFETNVPETEVLAVAQDIKDLFPYQTRFDGVLLRAPTVIEKGYRDGPDWRTPIVVRFQA
jgi:hypothetical protein